LSALPPGEQAFLLQQALHELQISLLVLDAQAALRVHAGVGQIPTPGRCQLALALVISKNLVDDLHHRLALEHIAVLPVAQEGQPRFHGEPVAGHATVAAQQLGLGDVAVPGSQVHAAVGGEKLQQRGLADEALEFEVGVGAERLHAHRKAIQGLGVRAREDGLMHLGALGQQRIGAQRGVQAQQARALSETAAECGHDVGDQAHEVRPIHMLVRICSLPDAAAAWKARACITVRCT